MTKHTALRVDTGQLGLMSAEDRWRTWLELCEQYNTVGALLSDLMTLCESEGLGDAIECQAVREEMGWR
jgi:hypothetical protein